MSIRAIIIFSFLVLTNKLGFAQSPDPWKHNCINTPSVKISVDSVSQYVEPSKAGAIGGYMAFPVWINVTSPLLYNASSVSVSFVNYAYEGRFADINSARGVAVKSDVMNFPLSLVPNTHPPRYTALISQNPFPITGFFIEDEPITHYFQTMQITINHVGHSQTLANSEDGTTEFQVDMSKSGLNPCQF